MPASTKLPSRRWSEPDGVDVCPGVDDNRCENAAVRGWGRSSDGRGGAVDRWRRAAARCKL